MNARDTAWLAGLMDGEASWCEIKKGAPSPHGGKQHSIQLDMSCIDIIKKVKGLTEHKGKIILPRKRNHERKQLHRIQWSGKNAHSLSNLLAPYMSDRRRERISGLLEQDIESIWNDLSRVEKFLWVCGYVEGEGSFFYHKLYDRRMNKSYGYRTFKLKSTDFDSMNRCGEMLNLKRCLSNPPSSRESGRQTALEIRTSKQSKFKEMTSRLYSHMGKKKKNDIRRVLESPVGRL